MGHFVPQQLKLRTDAANRCSGQRLDADCLANTGQHRREQAVKPIPTKVIAKCQIGSKNFRPWPVNPVELSGEQQS